MKLKLNLIFIMFLFSPCLLAKNATVKCSSFENKETKIKSNLVCLIENKTKKEQTCRVIVKTKIKGNRDKKFRGVLEVSGNGKGIIVLRGNKEILNKGFMKKTRLSCHPIPPIPGEPFEKDIMGKCTNFLDVCDIAYLKPACETLKLDCPDEYRKLRAAGKLR